MYQLDFLHKTNLSSQGCLEAYLGVFSVEHPDLGWTVHIWCNGVQADFLKVI